MYTDLQSYFNDAVAYLATMPRPAKRDPNKPISIDNGCTYLNPQTDERCIVGQFIPEGHPAAQTSGMVDKLIYDYPDLKGIAVPHCRDGVELAFALQLVHDDPQYWGPDGFRTWNALRLVAFKFNIEFTQPDLTVEILEKETVL